MEGKSKKWLPLEANPEVMNSYIGNLGFPVDSYQFVDVFSCEPWALEMIPQPVLGLVLLFPVTKNAKRARREEENRIIEQGQEVSRNVYYLKQTVSNACGTIGLVHIVGNLRHSDVLDTDIQFRPNSFFDSFFRNTENMTAEERGEYLEKGDAVADAIESAHQDAARSGQSSVPGIDDKVTTHFIAIVPKDGNIYELDGRKKFPINHGPFSLPESFGLEACERVIRECYISKDPEELRFSILALVPTYN